MRVQKQNKSALKVFQMKQNPHKLFILAVFEKKKIASFLSETRHVYNHLFD